MRRTGRDLPALWDYVHLQAYRRPVDYWLGNKLPPMLILINPFDKIGLLDEGTLYERTFIKQTINVSTSIPKQHKKDCRGYQVKHA